MAVPASIASHGHAITMYTNMINHEVGHGHFASPVARYVYMSTVWVRAFASQSQGVVKYRILRLPDVDHTTAV